MTDPTETIHFLNIGDDRAALDMGVLAAAAESALPGAPREAQLALAWISAHVAADGARVWTARIDGLRIEDRLVGDWSLTVRSETCQPTRIGIERRATLRSDGREVMALAHPFLEGTADDPGRGLELLLDFSVAMLASRAPEAANGATVSTSKGARMHFRLRKTGHLKPGRKKLSDATQWLRNFFPTYAKN